MIEFFYSLALISAYSTIGAVVGYAVYWFHPSRGSRYNHTDAIVLGTIAGVCWPVSITPTIVLFSLAKRREIADAYHAWKEKSPEDVDPLR